jgi:hypothetical protein
MRRFHFNTWKHTRRRKEVNRMNATLTIEEFNALLSSKQDNGALLTVLRNLMGIEKPEDVVSKAAPMVGWGWRTVTPTDR